MQDPADYIELEKRAHIIVEQIFNQGVEVQELTPSLYMILFGTGNAIYISCTPHNVLVYGTGSILFNYGLQTIQSYQTRSADGSRLKLVRFLSGNCAPHGNSFVTEKGDFSEQFYVWANVLIWFLNQGLKISKPIDQKPEPVETKQHAKRSLFELPYVKGSKTSQNAAVSAKGKAEADRIAILGLFEKAGSRGLTADEVGAKLVLDHSTYSARVSELFHKYKAIKKAGRTRLTRKGRRAEVYISV